MTKTKTEKGNRRKIKTGLGTEENYKNHNYYPQRDKGRCKVDRGMVNNLAYGRE